MREWHYYYIPYYNMVRILELIPALDGYVVYRTYSSYNYGQKYTLHRIASA